MHLYLREAYKQKDYELTTSLLTKGYEIKETYMSSIQEDITKYHVRLIYKGFELKDDQPIYEHNIGDDARIIVILNPKE